MLTSGAVALLSSEWLINRAAAGDKLAPRQALDEEESRLDLEGVLSLLKIIGP